jgi:hypothetical protein
MGNKGGSLQKNGFAQDILITLGKIIMNKGQKKWVVPVQFFQFSIAEKSSFLRISTFFK